MKKLAFKNPIPFSVDVINYSSNTVRFDLRNLRRKGLSVIGKLPRKNGETSLIRFITDNKTALDSMHERIIFQHQHRNSSTLKCKTEISCRNYMSAYTHDPSCIDIPISLPFNDFFNVKISLKPRRHIRITIFLSANK